MEGVLMVSAVTTAIVATAYGLLARRLAAKRSADPQAQVAIWAFAAWWGISSLNVFITTGLYATAALGHTNFSVQLTLALFQRLLLSAALVGLMSYITYLYTGRTRMGFFVALYTAYYVFQLWTLFSGQPDGVRIARWRSDLAYTVAPPAWLPYVTYAWVVGPPVLGAILYLLAGRKVEDPMGRLRVNTVSVGIILWWGFAIAAGQRATLELDWLQVTNRLVGLGVAIALLLVYDPPAWLRRRVGGGAAPPADS